MTFSYWTTIYEYTRCPRCWGTGYIFAGDKTNNSTADLCPLCKGKGRVKICQEYK